MIKIICSKVPEPGLMPTGFCLQYIATAVSDGAILFGGNFDVCLTGEETMSAVNQAIVDAGKDWATSNGLTVIDKDIWYEAISRG